MTADESTALAPAERAYTGLVMAVTPAEAKKRLKALQAFVRSVMVEGEDYGRIPGIERKTLLQPGAQKLAELYGLHPTFEWVEVVKNWDAPFFYFEAKCRLFSRRDEQEVGQGIGSTNSRENKYAGRWSVASEIPPHIDVTTLEKREGYSWVFQKDIPEGMNAAELESRTLTSKRTGNPYTQWRAPVVTYLLPNPDLFSQVNTMQKMAAKRALIHAVIGATRSAAIFTQDVEDLPDVSLRKDEAPMPPAGEKKVRKPREPKPAPPAPSASTLLSTDAQQKLYLHLVDGIRSAPDLEALRKVLTEINANRLKMLAELFAELGAKVKARKLEFEAALATPNTTTDGNSDWGISPEDKQPNEEKAEREPGQEG